MPTDNVTDNYKLERSYVNKRGFKVKKYTTCYNNEKAKSYVQEEITRSCLKIFDNIKN